MYNAYKLSIWMGNNLSHNVQCNYRIKSYGMCNLYVFIQ